MSYIVTAQDKDGRVLWTKDVTATCFEGAVWNALAGDGAAGVHSLLVTKG